MLLIVYKTMYRRGIYSRTRKTNICTDPNKQTIILSNNRLNNNKQFS